MEQENWGFEAFMAEQNDIDNNPSGSRKRQHKDGPLLLTRAFTKEDADTLINPATGACTKCDLKFKIPAKTFDVRMHFENCHREEFQHYIGSKAKKQTKMSDFVISKGGKERAFMFGMLTSPIARDQMEKNEHFKLFFRSINLPLPTAYQLSKMAEQEMDNIRASVLKMVKGSPYALSLDIATTKNMRISVLGGSIHFIDIVQKRLVTVVLDLLKLEGSHTAENVRASTLKMLNSFGLDPFYAFRTVSDGGRNMRAALYDSFDPDSDEEDEIDTSGQADHDSDAETDEREDEETEEIQLLEDVMPCFNLWCACHRLQLVSKDAIEKDKQLSKLRSRVFRVLNKFARSHVATNELQRRSQKSLLFPATTRWLSIFLVYERVLEIFDHINAVANTQPDWPTLNGVQRKSMKNVVTLLTPMKGLVDRLQSNDVTISLLKPAIMKLIKGYGKMDILPNVTAKIVLSLKSRFADVLNDEDPIYHAACALDPRVCSNYLDATSLKCIQQISTTTGVTVQMVQSQTSSSIKKLIDFGFDDSSNDSQIDIELPGDALIIEWKNFCNLDPFGDEEPVAFWINNKKKYPLLAECALKVFCVPASSAHVERMFSQMTLSSSHLKSNAKIQLINQRTFLTMNKEFLTP